MSVHLSLPAADLRTRAARLPISMRASHSSGKRLRAVVKTIFQSYAQCEIVVADWVHRHTIGEEAALALGDAWLHENQVVCQMSAVRIIRWKELLCNGYGGRAQFIKELYAGDDAFRAAINAGIDRIGSLHPNLPRHGCLAFLLEELAVWATWEDMDTYYAGDNLIDAGVVAMNGHTRKTRRIFPILLRGR